MRQNAGSGNAERAMNREEDKLRYQIEALEEEIARYENNLGFFSMGNKNAKNPLMKDVEEKIKKLKSDIQDLRTRLKVLATPAPSPVAEIEAEAPAEIEHVAEVETNTDADAE